MISITNKIKIIDLALYIPKNEVLIFSDFHMGYEEVLNAQGILLPRFQFKDTITRLDSIFAQLKDKKIKTIVINGDLKHEFGSIRNQEWREVLHLIDYLAQHAEEVVIVKGNHDAMLNPIVQKRSIKLVVDYALDDILISHGDEIAEEEKQKKAKTIIIGHDHPAIGIRENNRREVFKCFLKRVWKKKMIIVQPSFNVLVEGSDILKEKALSPYLQDSLKNVEVWVVVERNAQNTREEKPPTAAKSHEVLYFGKVGDMQREQERINNTKTI